MADPEHCMHFGVQNSKLVCPEPGSKFLSCRPKWWSLRVDCMTPIWAQEDAGFGKCAARPNVLSQLRSELQSASSILTCPMPLVPCCMLSYSYAKLLLLCCRAQEEAEFREFAARPNVIELIQKRIAPQIFGAERIKEAIACLLFGGSRKVSHIFSAVCSP